jgi:hypothetical protein
MPEKSHFGSILESPGIEKVGIPFLWPTGTFIGHSVYFFGYILCICFGHLVYLWPYGVYLRPFGMFYGHLVYFMAIWYILWSFGVFYGHLVYFMAIWYILWPFGIYYGHLVHFMAIWYILWPFGTFWFVMTFDRD